MPEHQQIQQSKKPNTIFQKQATPVIQTPVSNPYSIIQRAKINPKSLTHADVMQLQRTIGNRAVAQLLSGIVNSSTAQQATVQRQEVPEEEEPLQGKFAETIQCQEIPEEEEPLQGRFKEPIQRQEIPEEEEPLQGKMIGTIQRQEIPKEEEPLQGKFENKPEIACPSCFAATMVQRQEIPEEEEPLQGKMIETIQRQEIPEEEEPLQGKFQNSGQVTCPSCSAVSLIQKQEIPEEEEPLQGKMIGTIQRQEIPEEEEPLQTKRENNTGMPDNLKAGVESLSGMDVSDVKIYYNSDKPAQIGALAYTQGTDIHVASGQEKHLPHEAWHVVQQKQGRVRATSKVGGMPLNDSMRLESEADGMGGKALQKYVQVEKPKENKSRAVASSTAQMKNSGKQSFGFVDNRPEATGHRKLIQQISNSTTKLMSKQTFVSGQRQKKESKTQNDDGNALDKMGSLDLPRANDKSPNHTSSGVVQCIGLLAGLTLGILGAAAAYGLYRWWNAGRDEQDPYNGYILSQNYDSDDDSDYEYNPDDDWDDSAEDRLERMRNRGNVRRERARIPIGRYQTPTGMTTLSGLWGQRMTQSRQDDFGGQTFGSMPTYSRLQASLPFNVLESLENPRAAVPRGLSDQQRLATALTYTLVHGSEEDRSPGTSAYVRAMVRDYRRTGGQGAHPLNVDVFPARSTAQEQRDLMEGRTQLTEQQRRALEEDSEPSSDEEDDHFLLR